MNKRKPGSGKTKGAVSFVEIPLKSLTRNLGPSMCVIVSRLWAESLSLEGKPVTAKAKKK
jgi:hypothetical protein